MMNKSRKTSNLYNIITYDDNGNVVLPASLSLGSAPASDDNSLKVGTTSWIRTYISSLSLATSSTISTEIANLIDSAPSTLNTLNELAAALGDDANFSTTVTTSIASKVPQTRTITINGTAYDLSEDRSWSIAAGVTSFNTRTGAITLTSGDVTDVLGYTPSNDTLVVKLAGAQTITGAKTFQAAPKIDTDLLLKNVAGSPDIASGYTSIRGISGTANSVDYKGITVIDSAMWGASLRFGTDASYDFTFPSTSGTVALTSDLSTYLPLSGGTLTGQLTATSPSFPNPSLILKGNIDFGSIQFGDTSNYVLRAGTDLVSMEFIVGGSQKMLILDNGNVGIGTSNPIIALSVRKDVNDWIGQFKNYGEVAYGLTVDLSGSTGSTAGYALGVYTQTGTGLFVKNNGSVGIGNTAPAYKLDVSGTGNFTGYILANQEVYDVKNRISDGFISLTTASGGRMIPQLEQKTESDAIGSYFFLNRATNVSAITGFSITAWRFTTDFNVTSGNLLEVMSNYNQRFTVNHAGAGTFAGKITATQSAISSSQAGSDWLSSWSNSASNGHNMYFGYGNADGTRYGLLINGGSGSNFDLGVANKFYVMGSGNVGINTTNPQSKLEVIGDARAGNFGLNTESTFRGGLYSYKNVLGSGTDFGVTIFAEGGTGNGNIYFCPNGSANKILTVQADGEIIHSKTNAIITQQGGSGYSLFRMYGNTNGVELQLGAHQTSGVGTIGTYSNSALVFKTNNTERMSISSGGYLTVFNDANLELYKGQTVDMSSGSYSTSNFYPVVIDVPGSSVTIQIQNNLNSNTPSWSTHSGGFTLNLKWTTNGSGWGTTEIKRKVYQYHERFTNSRICGGITQMGTSSQEVVWLRGGGVYYFTFSRNVSATAYSTTYTNYYATESAAPRSSVVNDVWNSAAGSEAYFAGTIYSDYLYTGGGNGYHASFKPTGGATFNIGSSSGNIGTTGPFVNATYDGTANTSAVPLFFNCSVFSVFVGYSEKMRLNSSGTLYIGDGIVQYYGSWSDIKLKEDLKVITNPLTKISKLTGYTFKWTKDSPYRDTPAIGERINDAGLIAQDVEEVLPEVVTETNYKHVNYNGVVALHTEGIKELIKQNSALLARIQELEKKLL